jgi:hypothetical protein
MVKRSTWIMVVLMAIAAGLAYYLQQPDNLIKKTLASKETPTAESPGLLVRPEDGPLKSISVQSADGKSVSIKQNNTGWMLFLGTEGPIPADQGAAQQTASQVMELRLVAAIATKPSDLSVFGLDKPIYILTLVLNDDKSVTYKIGGSTLTGSGYYIEKDDGSVVVIDKYGTDVVLNMMNQPPYMFTPTPSPVPATETPTPLESTTGTITPTSELTSTKQP